MPTTQIKGTTQTLLSTELNSLANNSNAVHASSIALTSSGYPDAEVELVLAAVGSAFTANTPVYVWFLQETDGSNFEDGSASVTPTRNPDVIFTLRGVTAAQRIVQEIFNIPVGNIRALVRNQGGVAFAASGNTLSIRPKSYS